MATIRNHKQDLRGALKKLRTELAYSFLHEKPSYDLTIGSLEIEYFMEEWRGRPEIVAPLRDMMLELAYIDRQLSTDNWALCVKTIIQKAHPAKFAESLRKLFSKSSEIDPQEKALANSMIEICRQIASDEAAPIPLKIEALELIISHSKDEDLKNRAVVQRVAYGGALKDHEKEMSAAADKIRAQNESRLRRELKNLERDHPVPPITIPKEFSL